MIVSLSILLFAALFSIVPTAKPYSLQVKNKLNLAVWSLDEALDAVWALV